MGHNIELLRKQCVNILFRFAAKKIEIFYSLLNLKSAKPAKYPLSIEYLNGKQIIYESTMCRRKNQKEAMPVNVWHGLSMNGFKCWKLFCP